MLLQCTRLQGRDRYNSAAATSNVPGTGNIRFFFECHVADVPVKASYGRCFAFSRVKVWSGVAGIFATADTTVPTVVRNAFGRRGKGVNGPS